ncbi:hypothetical protein [Nocardia sp. 348MFTsu5.1]|uniref:hypothetical protein n=1 Tax=Nocardia sp. 348MFTsu5.1 TaxID=1172185 RepID=UPI00035D961D|nr:hypothetical protein [Nocardia sp. 348MFTsu5.1]
MSVVDLFDEIVSAARRKTDSATKTYDQQMAVFGERVRVRAEDDRHRRGVTRESVARGGAILLPADDIDLSPHSPMSGPAPISDTAGGAADETRTAADATTADDDPVDTVGGDSSYESGWLSDR